MVIETAMRSLARERQYADIVNELRNLNPNLAAATSSVDATQAEIQTDTVRLPMSRDDTFQAWTLANRWAERVSTGQPEVRDVLAHLGRSEVPVLFSYLLERLSQEATEDSDKLAALSPPRPASDEPPDNQTTAS